MSIKFDGLRAEVAEIETAVRSLESTRASLSDSLNKANAEIVELKARIAELEPEPEPEPVVLAVPEWLEKRGFIVDGDQSKLSLSSDGKFVRVAPGSLRAEFGPRHERLAMIGRLPLSDTTQRHVFAGYPSVLWRRHSSKVVAWQAWHTSNHNPSLSYEIVGGVQRIVYSFNGRRIVLAEATFMAAVWEIQVDGWRPGKRGIRVFWDGVMLAQDSLELLPAGSTEGPVIKTGAYFPSWKDGQRLDAKNEVVIPADWTPVTP